MTSPLMSGFCIMLAANNAYSLGSPNLCGKGTDAANADLTLSGSCCNMGVSKRPEKNQIFTYKKIKSKENKYTLIK